MSARALSLSPTGERPEPFAMPAPKPHRPVQWRRAWRVLRGLIADPERTELVHYEDDSLIPLKADRGMHIPHAFVGDDGQGRALYLHVGRAIRRADAAPVGAVPAAG